MTGKSHITIRRAAVHDAETIAAFNSAMAIETEDHHLDPSIVGPGTREGLADESKAIYFVAEIDQKIVGQIMITHEWSDWRNGDIWWIQSVYVSPDARRRGVFRAMYEHVQSRAKDAGAIGLRLYVDADNVNAQATYREMGMSVSNYKLMEVMFR